MRSTRTRIELVLPPILLCVALGCRSSVAGPIGERREVPPQRGGTLHAATYVNVRSLDPAVAFDVASSALEGLIYDQLMGYDENGKLVPQLAETVDMSSDGKRYVFTLRPRVLFHDGKELTASDVKRSIERSLHHDTPCPVASYYERIVGFAAYHDGKAPELTGVEVAGSRAIAINLSEPDATFLHVMALPIVTPVCESAGRSFQRDFTLRPCGTGPFRVLEYNPNQRIRLERHQGYWRPGRPYLDGVEWQLAVQTFVQRVKFERGELDYMRDFSEADSVLYRSSPAWQGFGEWEQPLNVYGIFMNNELAPFDNVHVRRAVAFAIDPRVVESVYPGHITARHRVIPPTLLDPGSDAIAQSHDLGRALEEMKLAGLAYDPVAGKGGYPKEIPYLAVVDTFAQQAAEIFQQQLAKIGIRIRIELLSFPSYLARSTRRKNALMGYVGWNADYAEPSTFLEPSFASSSILDEESMNAAFFSDRTFDELLKKARRSTDALERDVLYRRAEDRVLEEAPWAVTYSYRYFELWQPYMHGYRPHPVLTQYLRNAYFDLEQRRARTRGDSPSRGALAAFARRGRGAPATTLALSLLGASR